MSETKLDTIPHTRIVHAVPRLKKLKQHKKMLSTLYESYKDNIEEPYKQEFRKTLFGPNKQHPLHLNLGDHTSTTRDSVLKKHQHHSAMGAQTHKNSSMGALTSKKQSPKLKDFNSALPSSQYRNPSSLGVDED